MGPGQDLNSSEKNNGGGKLEKRILEAISSEYNKLDPRGSQTMNIVVRKVYSVLPGENEDLIKLFDFLVSRGEWRLFWLVTVWIKRKKLYQRQYMAYYEKWLHKSIKGWGQ